MGDKLDRLFEALSVVYDVKETQMTAIAQINLISEPYELLSSYGEKDGLGGAGFGLPTLCDEFSVQVGFDDFPTTTTIAMDTTATNAVWMEFLSEKVGQPTVGQSASWGVARTPSDLTIPLNNGYGGLVLFVPGSRTVRFHFRGTPLSLSTGATAKATVLSMTVFGRVRNEGATRRILQAIYDRVGDIDGLLRHYEARQSELERQMARFERHQDPLNPLLVPATMRR